MSDEITPVSRQVPVLKGTENFIAWQRALKAYLMGKGALRVLEGRDKEPFRANTPIGIVLNEYAGAEPPRAPLADALDGEIDYGASSTGRALTATEMAKWETWEAKERTARSTILLSISAPLAVEVENLWSAHQIYERIKFEHQVDTTERRGGLMMRLTLLRLEGNITRERMIQHLDTFVNLNAELISAGHTLPEWQKCESFLMTLGNSFETLKNNFRLASSQHHTWPELTRQFKTLADCRGFEEDRMAEAHSLQAQANAMYINKDALKTKKPSQGQWRGGRGGRRGGNNGGRKKEAKRCHHCNTAGHLEKDCRRKIAGEPSHNELKNAAASLKQGKTNERSIHAVGQGRWDIGSLPSINHIAVATDETVDFLFDSGATHHLTKDQSVLCKVQPLTVPINFNVASMTGNMVATHKGTITLPTKDGSYININDVYHIPDARGNILSSGLLQVKGWSIDRDDLAFHFGSQTVELTRRGILSYAKALSVPIAAAITGTVSEMEILHRRLGHQSPTKILQMIAEKTLEGDAAALRRDPFQSNSQCDVCLRQKATSTPKAGSSPRGTADGEMIHADIKGHVETSADGNNYYLGVVADYTGVRYAIPIRSKAQAFSELRGFIAQLERQANIKVKFVRTDQGTEFDSIEARSFFAATGIIHQQSPRYSPEHNGVAERFNRTMSEMIAAMVDASALGHPFWDFAARYASIILNKTSVGQSGKNAWTTMTGRAPAPRDLLEFGTIVQALIPEEIRRKSRFDLPRAERARILGQDPNSTGWIVRFELATTKIVVRDIKVIDEPISTPLSVPPKPFIRPRAPEVETIPRPQPVQPQHPPIPVITTAPTAAPAPEQPTPATERPVSPIVTPREAPTEPQATLPVQLPQPRRSNRLRSADDNNDATGGKTSTPMAAQLCEAVYAVAVNGVGSPDPTTLRQALARPDAEEWLDAMRREADNLDSKGTFQEVVLPPNRKAVGSKWVFKLKRDENGRPVKYKARLVAQGFSQLPGIDFEETFAPVGRIASLRILLAAAATFDLELIAGDVEGAYLNGVMDVELYISFPEGMSPTDPKHNALRVLKSLYGLKQSGRTWWIELGEALEEIGFKRCGNDWGFYVLFNSDNSPAMLLLAYVDDLLLASKNRIDIDVVFEKLKAKWTLTVLGEAKHILGLKIERDRANRRIYLSQGAYIDKLAERFPDHPTREAKHAPLPTGHDDRAEESEEIAARPYQEIVGSLMWLAGCTRPDLSYTASFLARKSSAPTAYDMSLALRAVSHAVQTRDHRLELGGNKSSTLTTYVDSDWGGCRETRRSTTGYISFLYDSPINWVSKRQATVSSSSMEAEYIAAAEATRDVLWLRSLLDEMGMTQDGPTTVHVDNQSAIHLASNPIMHPRSKHIELRHHLVRERVADGTIALRYIPTTEQRADILTKALSGPTHSTIVESIRLSAPATGFIGGVFAKEKLSDRIDRKPSLRDRIGNQRSLRDRMSKAAPLLERISKAKATDRGPGPDSYEPDGIPISVSSPGPVPRRYEGRSKPPIARYKRKGKGNPTKTQQGKEGSQPIGKEWAMKATTKHDNNTKLQGEDEERKEESNDSTSHLSRQEEIRARFSRATRYDCAKTPRNDEDHN